MTTTYWWCLGCPEGGVYDQKPTGGQAEKHTKDTGHGTATSLHPKPEGWGNRDQDRR